ncbi:GatB/YqeY domain-containing protein [soil metagenome]
MTLAEKIRADLKASMMAKDELRTSTLRMVQAEMLKKEKEKVGLVLDDALVSTMLGTVAKQRRDSIEQFTTAGRADLAAKEQKELDVILAYLPTALTDAEIDIEVDKAIAAAGATDASQAGKVMGSLMKALKATGKPYDGNAVQAKVKGKLGG